MRENWANMAFVFCRLIDRCHEDEAQTVVQSVTKFCDDLYNNKDVRASFLLAAKVDLLSRKMESEDESSTKEEDLKQATEVKFKTVQICPRLIVFILF